MQDAGVVLVDAGTVSGTAPTPAVELDYHAVLSDGVVALVLIALVLGFFGGLARVVKQATEASPPKLSVWPAIGGALVGAVAGVAAFYILTPTTSLRFISASLIAGYAGPALLDALEARFKLLSAEARANHAVDAGIRALDAADTTIAGSGGRSAADSVGKRAEIEALRAELNALRRKNVTS